MAFSTMLSIMQPGPGVDGPGPGDMPALEGAGALSSDEGQFNQSWMALERGSVRNRDSADFDSLQDLITETVPQAGTVGVGSVGNISGAPYGGFAGGGGFGVGGVVAQGGGDQRSLGRHSIARGPAGNFNQAQMGDIDANLQANYSFNLGIAGWERLSG